MEHAPGKQLALVWPDMGLEHKVRTMEDVVSIQQRLLSMSFSRLVIKATLNITLCLHLTVTDTAAFTTEKTPHRALIPLLLVGITYRESKEKL